MSMVATTDSTGLSNGHHATVWIPKTTQNKHSPSSGINPLVDNAANFFQLLNMLAQKPDGESNMLFEQAKQAVQDIKLAYGKLDYPKDILAAAHFSLCATLDDVIFNHLPSSDIKLSLLQTFHQQNNYEQKFFSVLNHTITSPEKYIDLTELMYLCMIFGFRGQFRKTAYNFSQYSQLTEKVYRAIVITRGEHSRQLSPNIEPAELPKKKLEKVINWKNYCITGIGVVISLAMILSTFHFIYSNATIPFNVVAGSVIHNEETNRK